MKISILYIKHLNVVGFGVFFPPNVLYISLSIFLKGVIYGYKERFLQMSPCLTHAIPEQKFPTTSVIISLCLYFVSSLKSFQYSLQIHDFLNYYYFINSLFLLQQLSSMAWPRFSNCVYIGSPLGHLSYGTTLRMQSASFSTPSHSSQS